MSFCIIMNPIMRKLHNNIISVSCCIICTLIRWYYVIMKQLWVPQPTDGLETPCTINKRSASNFEEIKLPWVSWKQTRNYKKDCWWHCHRTWRRIVINNPSYKKDCWWHCHRTCLDHMVVEQVKIRHAKLEHWSFVFEYETWTIPLDHYHFLEQVPS